MARWFWKQGVASLAEAVLEVLATAEVVAEVGVMAAWGGVGATMEELVIEAPNIGEHQEGQAVT